MKNLLLFLWIFLLLFTLLGGERGEALSLGELQVQSRLGSPLRAVIPLRVSAEDWGKKFVVSAGSIADYRELGLIRPPVIEDLTVQVSGKQKSDRLFITLSSKRPITQPRFDLVIKVQLDGGTLLEKYSVQLSPTPEPAPPPAGRQQVYGPVAPGETLMDIARKIGATEETVSRVAVALWQQNRDAFIDANMHGLRVGSYLRYDDLDAAIRTISPAQARQILREQWAAWKSTRSETETPSTQTAPETPPVSPAQTTPEPLPVSPETKNPQKASQQTTSPDSPASVPTESLSSTLLQKLEALEQGWQERIDALRKEQRRLRREFDQKLLAAVDGELRNRVASLEFRFLVLAGAVSLLLVLFLGNLVLSWTRRRRQQHAQALDQELGQVLDI
ncbi:MAG: hypothetical protein D6736_03825 [Nitrospinota bacterium]|nr:MAG: hypothetical protein D6736_03825 [Nitrospinota bacterium]